MLAAEANAALSSSSSRLLTLLAGLVAVALVLLAVFRDPGRALVPLIPIALATGWSALILFLIGIPLNPMSAALGALVIAISTEFSVLLSERFRQERRDGHAAAERARPHVPVDRLGGARLRDHRDRRLRRADRLEHHDAARFRLCDCR